MRAQAPLLLCCALLAATQAQAVPPELRWYTLETPHFRVHFHEGPNMEALAQRTARASEAAHALLVPRLRWTPRKKTDVILTDDVDSANGSAFTLYRPWMRLFAEPPSDQSVLNDYGDHLWNLVVHEYAHVLHLDTASGLPEAVNAVFGKLLLPNAYVPRWLTEGLATYLESDLSNSGRIRSSLFDMWLRASVLDRPFRLDEISHVPHRWPRGSLAYLYGGHFLDFLARRVGEEGLSGFFRLYGTRLLPWTLNDTAHRSWEEDFPALYELWLEETRERFLAQLQEVRQAGLTPFRVLTRSGYGTDSPRFTTSGDRIVYLAAAPDRRPELRVMNADGTSDRLVRALWSGGPLDLSPDDRKVVLALPEIHEQYQVLEDLWEVDLATGDLTRLTTGLRATDPVHSPDGTLLAFVGRSGAGHSYLGVLDRRDGQVRRLLLAHERERLHAPAFSPDGRSLVFSQKHGVGRRLVQLELTAQAQPRTLLEAEWLILQPRFTADGQLLFSADRTGIYNLHALDPRTGELRQLTNVQSGAFQPSPAPDGQVAFLTYSAQGYDVAVVAPGDFFGGELPERPPRPPPLWEDDPTELADVRPYRPMASLRPLYWLPLLVEDARGPVAGVVTGGEDILGRHRWGLEATYGLSSGEPGAYVTYQNRAFHPGIDAWAQTGISQVAGFSRGLYERQWAAGLRTTVPASSLDRSASVSLSYELRYFDPRFAVLLEPDSLRPTFPRRGRAGVAALSFYFSNARAYAHSVSQEEGWGLAASIRHSSPLTFGTFTFSSAEARAQTYFRMPWLKHHVLAAQLLGGAALGDLGDRPVYALGGIPLFDPLLQVISGQRVGSGALRGYPQRALTGNSYALGTAEYRFPLAYLDRGVSSLPFFLRRVHGAAFADAGATGPGALELERPRVGVGLELRTDVVMGYALGAQLRLGFARGLSEEGISQAYLTLGGPF